MGKMEMHKIGKTSQQTNVNKQKKTRPPRFDVGLRQRLLKQELHKKKSLKRSLSQRGFILLHAGGLKFPNMPFLSIKKKENRASSGVHVFNGLAAQEIATRLIEPDFKGSCLAIVNIPPLTPSW